MDLIDERLIAYCEQHSEQESALLHHLNRATHLKVPSPRMLSGHLQGRFLSMISHLAKPSRILEIGTYTGYSALCLAEGLAAEGQLITIDPNEETTHFAQQFINTSPLSTRIRIVSGDAAKVIPALGETFDLVFIDADKRSYAHYFDLVIDKVRPGGIILADNTLWDGKVIEEKKDADTKAIDDFNRKVASDARVAVAMLPLRDGITMMRRL